MFLRIDPSSGLPIYRQIKNIIEREIALGRLLPDEPLPSIRQLALELSVNPHTIAQAYRELEHEGIVYTRHGQGTFVVRRNARMSSAERQRAVAALLEGAIVEGVSLELSEAELRRLFAQVLGRVAAVKKNQRALAGV